MFLTPDQDDNQFSLHGDDCGISGLYMLQRLNHTSKIGRRGGIRTPDPLLPKQMRYQAALHAEIVEVKNAYGVFID